MPECGAERPPGFHWIAALLDGFLEMRFELFVYLAAQTIDAKYICDAGP
jgi:hypothetical protein